MSETIAFHIRVCGAIGLFFSHCLASGFFIKKVNNGNFKSESIKRSKRCSPKTKHARQKNSRCQRYGGSDWRRTKGPDACPG